LTVVAAKIRVFKQQILGEKREVSAFEENESSRIGRDFQVAMQSTSIKSFITEQYSQ
jgi:hypothetical protein